jgi:hypothetical protein
MNDAPEDFDKLQKLLKLKRYEVPPPGYFNHFSTHVINRLEREFDRAPGEADWVKRFLGMLETNPIAAGLFGMSVCGLLISGIAYSQYQAPLADTASAKSNVTISVADNGAANVPELTKAASIDSTAVVLNGTNAGSAFDRISLQATPINFQLNQ